MSSKTRIKQIILDSNWTAAGSAEYQIKNIGNPTELQDVATKYYVDAAITGSTFTGANGITTTTGDTVELGGILNKTTTISGASQTFNLGTSGSQLVNFNVNSIQGLQTYSSGSNVLTITDNPGGRLSKIQTPTAKTSYEINPGLFDVQYSGGSGVSSLQLSGNYSLVTNDHSVSSTNYTVNSNNFYISPTSGLTTIDSGANISTSKIIPTSIEDKVTNGTAITTNSISSSSFGTSITNGSNIQLNNTLSSGGWNFDYTTNTGTTTNTLAFGGSLQVDINTDGIMDFTSTGGTLGIYNSYSIFQRNANNSHLRLDDTFTRLRGISGNTVVYDNGGTLTQFNAYDGRGLTFTSSNTNLIGHSGTTLVIGSSGDTTFTDGSSVKSGIEYAANYSSGFTNRSLVDKQYVDNAITGVSSTDTYTTGSTLVGSTLVFNTTDALSAYTADVSTLLNTAGSGINLGGTAINLGGALSADATITGGGSWNVNLGSAGSKLAGFTTNALTNTITGTNGTNTSSIAVTPTTLTLTSSSGSTFILNGTGNIFTDNTSALQGIKYGANYATTFTNRSLVDKEYVDGVAAGLDPKASVQATTTGNITLSGLTVQGGGDWNTGLTAGDRILVKNQASAVNNGIYVAASGVWSRATDSDGTPSNEVTLGNYTLVEGQNSGNTQSGTAWVIVSSNAADPKNQIVPGTDTQVWSKYSEQTTLSNGNGTTANGSAIDLGGTLSQTTSILGASQALTLGTTGSKVSTLEANASTSVTLNATNGTTSALSLTPTVLTLTSSTGSTFVMNTTSNTFTDATVSLNGIKYATDYSATFVNRSLVDKQYVDNAISALTKSIPTEYNAAAISGFTGGTGILATDPFGADVLDADMTPAVYLNGVKYKVGNGTTTGVDCWFAAVGVPGTAIAFNALTNALTLVWSVTNSTIPIDTSDDISVVYTKVV